jgi:hypothetical protein
MSLARLVVTAVRVEGQGQDSNLCRRSRRFTGRSGVALRVPSHPRMVPLVAHDVCKRPSGSSRRHGRPRPFRPVPGGLASGGGKVKGTRPSVQQRSAW